MFQFRRFPAYAYLIQRTLTEYCSAGFPHSEICGSKLMCSSPQLIAACHVLRRLLMPRHSPCALFSLTNRKQTFACSRCELCRLHKDQNCNRYPNIFPDVVPQLKFAFHTVQYGNLSVALLHLHVTLFSFQGASFQPLLKPDLKVQFLGL